MFPVEQFLQGLKNSCINKIYICNSLGTTTKKLCGRINPKENLDLYLNPKSEP